MIIMFADIFQISAPSYDPNPSNIEPYMIKFGSLHKVASTEFVPLKPYIFKDLNSSLCTKQWRKFEGHELYIRTHRDNPYTYQDGSKAQKRVTVLICDFHKNDKVKQYLGVTVNGQLQLVEVEETSNEVYFVKKGSQYANELENAIRENEGDYDWLENSPIPDYSLKRQCVITTKADPKTITGATLVRVFMSLLPFAHNREVEAIKCDMGSKKAQKTIHLLSISSRNATFQEIEQSEDRMYFKFKGHINPRRAELNTQFHQENIAQSTNPYVHVLTWMDRGLPHEVLEHKCHETMNQRVLMIQKYDNYYHYIETRKLKLLWNEKEINMDVDAIVCISRTEGEFIGILSPYDRNLLTPINVIDGEYAEIEEGKPFYLTTTTNKFKMMLALKSPNNVGSVVTLFDFTPVMKKKCAEFVQTKNLSLVKRVAIHFSKLLLRPYHRNNYLSEMISCEFEESHSNFMAVFSEFEEKGGLNIVTPAEEDQSAYSMFIPEFEFDESVSMSSMVNVHM